MDIAERSVRLLDEVAGPLDGTGVGVRTWDGRAWGDNMPRTTIDLAHPGSIRAMFWPPNDLSLGEAYVYGDYDILGDVEHAFVLADRLSEIEDLSRAKQAALAARLTALPSASHRDGGRAAHVHGRLHSRKRDSEAVRYHYDVGNEFYRLWLDDTMSYSCGYFGSGTDSLDDAQCRKIDHICRKLLLKPGDRLLDIGCGWGGLAIRAARDYGANVLGVTLSEPQAELANRRIAEAGLSERARVQVADYRDIDDWGGFEALVSVGMAEHVGRARMDEYFSRANALLKPGGLFMNHAISTDWSNRGSIRPGSFLQRYVFPDGELLPVSETLASAEGAGFEVRDVESLREHYAMTLRHWVRRLEARQAEARALVGEEAWRVWRLYMAGSAHAFDSGSISVFQSLLRKQDGGGSGLPLTRAHLYA